MVNGKSVWDMLTLDAAAGTILRLEVEGEDAEECLVQLTELLRDPDNEKNA
jgi:phosphotransferase system HPr-like phosphotransfer protein